MRNKLENRFFESYGELDLFERNAKKKLVKTKYRSFQENFNFRNSFGQNSYNHPSMMQGSFKKSQNGAISKEQLSKVLIVSNLIGFENAKEIQNILSCFGDINKILFMKNKKNALVEFTSVSYAEICKNHMNEQPYLCSNIVLSTSHSHSHINLQKSMRSQKAKLHNEAVIVLQEEKRFLNGLQDSVEAPSKKILACAKSNLIVNSEFIYYFLEKIQKPQNFKMLSSEQDNFVQLEFTYASVNEALRVMAKAGISQLPNSKMILYFSN